MTLPYNSSKQYIVAHVKFRVVNLKTGHTLENVSPAEATMYAALTSNMYPKLGSMLSPGYHVFLENGGREPWTHEELFNLALRSIHTRP